MNVRKHHFGRVSGSYPSPFRGFAVVVVGLSVATVPTRVAAQDVSLDTLAWLAGCWTSGSGDNETDEVWLAPRGGVMVGMARSVRAGVAAGHEFLVLRAVDGRMVYTAYPSSQQPTDFEVAGAERGLLRVQNADHDFPQKIEYRLRGPDSLVASVFADVADEQPAFEVPYVRGTCPGRTVEP